MAIPSIYAIATDWLVISPKISVLNFNLSFFIFLLNIEIFVFMDSIKASCAPFTFFSMAGSEMLLFSTFITLKEIAISKPLINITVFPFKISEIKVSNSLTKLRLATGSVTVCIFSSKSSVLLRSRSFGMTSLWSKLISVRPSTYIIKIDVPSLSRILCLLISGHSKNLSFNIEKLSSNFFDSILCILSPH